MKASKTTNVMALGAITVALLLGPPDHATGAQPNVTQVDYSYVTTDTCSGFPLLIHFKGTSIDKYEPGTGKFTYTFNARVEYTNLANGKMIRGVDAGPYYVNDQGDQVYSGLFMIVTPDGAVVDAGIEEVTFVYDPNTGTGSFVTSSHNGTGSDTSDIWAAICVALQ